MLYNSPIDIIKEACSAEIMDCCNCEDEFSDDENYEDDIEDDIDDIDDYEDDEDDDTNDGEDLDYTAEMVAVHQTNSGRYIVEMVHLNPYITRNRLSIEKAFINVCECNNIPLSKTYLLIESKDTILNAFKEAKEDCKNCKDPEVKKKKKGFLNTSIKNISNIKNLKNKGIHVCKKK